MHPLNSNFSFLCFSEPWNQCATFCLSASDRYLIEVENLSFCAWLILHSIMSSRFVYVEACARISGWIISHHMCKPHLSIHSSGHLGGLHPPTFWLLWIMLPWSGYKKYLFNSLISVLFCIKPEVELGNFWGINSFPRCLCIVWILILYQMWIFFLSFYGLPFYSVDSVLPWTTLTFDEV